MTQNPKETKKYKLLVLSIFFDLIGMLSYLIPGIGELMDIVWAPISVFIIFKMYKGDIGKVGGVVSFVEESIPGMDFIPTFSLIWAYKFLFKK